MKRIIKIRHLQTQNNLEESYRRALALNSRGPIQQLQSSSSTADQALRVGLDGEVTMEQAGLGGGGAQGRAETGEKLNNIRAKTMVESEAKKKKKL